MTDDPVAPDSPLDEPVDPFDAPDVIGTKAARLALQGVLLRGILNQHPQQWQVLCTRVKLGCWRARIEVIEQADGPDLAFILEIRESLEQQYDIRGRALYDWHGLISVHRAQLGLPRLDGDKARMLALLSKQAPDDASELAGDDPAD